ncbi:MAG: carbohydrate ABC transporter permease, partial [Pseudomonadota bacterium]
MSSAAQRRPLALQIGLFAFLALWFIAAAFPFMWTLWGSFKVELDFFSIA